MVVWPPQRIKASSKTLYHRYPPDLYKCGGSASGGRKAVGGSGGWRRLRYWAQPAGASYTPGRARPPDAPPYLGEAALSPLQIPPTGGSRSCATAISPGASLIPSLSNPTAGAGRTETSRAEPELYGPCTAAACPPSRAAASASPPAFLS